MSRLNLSAFSEILLKESRAMSALFIPQDYFSELRREEIFPDATRPLEVELGCGDGTFFLGMAKEYPERDFFAMERMRGRVSKTCRKIHEAGLTNAKVMRLESAYTVGWVLATASVSRLHLLCPDPWPKKKHAERRLVNQEEFLTGLARVLVPGGEFLLKTDDAVYFEDALISLGARFEFERLEWSADAFFYPMTDFEEHWLSLGRTINRARWRRR
jgi:tRNA (guanine-N7-)-methyltransferase